MFLYMISKIWGNVCVNKHIKGNLFSIFVEHQGWTLTMTVRGMPGSGMIWCVHLFGLVWPLSTNAEI